MKLKRLLVIALSMMMVLGMSVNVFADGPAHTNTGTTVYLTAEFDVPQGVDVPTDDFTFTAAKVYDNSEVGLVAEADYPSLEFTKINFGNGDRKAETDTVLVKSSSVDLAGLTYPRAGVYKWNISENEPAGTNKAKITKGGETYILRVYVKNKANGSGTEIETITIEPTGGGDEKKIDAGLEDPKTDTTNPEHDADKDGVFTNDGNDFRFTNKYKPEDVTTNPTDPDTPDNPNDDTGAFKLTKTVTGKYGDKTNKFTFTVNVSLPDGTTIDDYKAAKTAGEDTQIKVGANEVKLADGETFSITKLPEGTIITVTEAATPHYIPYYTGNHTVNGAVDPLIAVGKADANKGKDVAVAEDIVVGTKGANVAYTNEFVDGDVTPTGIVINNLPYILLIAIALGGIVLFARKRRYDR